MKNPYYDLGNGKEIYHINHFVTPHVSNMIKYLFRAGRKDNESFDKDIGKVYDYVVYEVERQKIYPCSPTLQSAFLHRHLLSDLLFKAMVKIENKFAQKVFKYLYEYIMYERKSSLNIAYTILDSYCKGLNQEYYSDYIYQEPLK